MNKSLIFTVAFSLLMILGCGPKPEIQGKLVYVKHASIYKFEKGKITKLTNIGDNYEPAISPDGSRIAFTSLRDGNKKTEIYLMDGNGDNVKKVTKFIEEKGWGAYPSWKDNQHLITVWAADTPVIFNLQRNINESYYNPGITTDGEEAHFRGFPKFSTDGLYRISYKPLEGRIVIIQESEPETQAKEIEQFYVNATINDPQFSPDSKKLLYTDNGNIMYYDLATHEKNTMKKANPDKFYYSDPCWSPDGTKIAVVKVDKYLWDLYKRSYIVVMNVDGTDEKTIARGAQPDWGK